MGLHSVFIVLEFPFLLEQQQLTDVTAFQITIGILTLENANAILSLDLLEVLSLHAQTVPVFLILITQYYRTLVLVLMATNGI